MRVLVVTASKHGATAEIGRSIADVLHTEGFEADHVDADQVSTVDGYDAVVIGSAVYAGHWMAPARDFVEREADRLRDLPVWLFSSGPIGEPPKPDEDPVEVGAIMEATGGLGHALFAGKLDKRALSFPERAIVSALRAPEGDFREWGTIEVWALGIVHHLTTKV